MTDFWRNKCKTALIGVQGQERNKPKKYLLNNAKQVATSNL